MLKNTPICVAFRLARDVMRLVSISWQGVFGQVCLSVLLVSGGAVCAQTADTRYVLATELRLRAAPHSAASAIGQLRINEPVELKGAQDGTWCPISARGEALHGWVGCAYLAPQPLTLDRIGEDIASATLALYRTTHAYSDSAAPQLEFTTRFVDPPVARGLLENLFAQLERHFALSPSIHTLADYENLTATVGQLTDASKADPSLAAPTSSRGGMLERMRRLLVQSDTTSGLPVVQHPATATLRMVLAERMPGSTRRAAKRAEALARATRDASPASRSSFFHDELWSVGWAGGPLVRRNPGRDLEGVAYTVNFDGASYRTLAGVYEMAKAHRIPVKAEFKAISGKGELAQTRSVTDGGPDGLVLRMRLPVWGITADGLVPGVLRLVSYGGDVCSESDSRNLATAVEVVFPKAVRGDLHGVFATNAVIDTEKAKVTVRKRTFLEPLRDSFETTLTHRVDMRVDLDGDGVDDLRTVVSQDTSVGRREEWMQDYALASPTIDRRWLRPVAGWYAYNVYMLQANHDGWWQPLSIYNVVTCT